MLIDFMTTFLYQVNTEKNFLATCNAVVECMDTCHVQILAEKAGNMKQISIKLQFPTDSIPRKNMNIAPIWLFLTWALRKRSWKRYFYFFIVYSPIV